MARFRVRHLFLALALASACADNSADAEVRGLVTALTQNEGPAVDRAAERLVPHGARAIVTIEAALHTASPAGRKNLILALRRIKNGDAVPLLRHLAVFDSSVDVRKEAKWTLGQWALESGELGQRARDALRAVDEQSGNEQAG